MIGRLTRNGLILILAALYAEAKVTDVWENGFKAGYINGYQEAVNQPPKMWKSHSTTGKIVKSN